MKKLLVGVILTDDYSNGFCECPSEQLVSISNPENGQTSSVMQSFILVEDVHYLEAVCMPVRSFNESCQYDQQCKALDVNLICSQVIESDVDGVASSDMVCTCVDGYRWSVGVGGSEVKCRIGGNVVDSRDWDSAVESVTSSASQLNDANKSNSTSNKMVYIWWIFPSSDSQG